MASVVELVMSIVNTLQAALAILTAGLNLTGYMYPESASVQNGATYDFIVVGAGSAGCVIANRLTEIPSVRVLHIEAGGDPRLESVLPGIFTLQPLTEQDYNITSSNDGRTAQNLKNGVVGMTQGKMLGGSSSLHHMIHVRGNPRDYKLWANAANDESWNYDNLIEYFVKSEKVEDEAILKSNLARYHGTAGILRLTTQRSDENEAIFTAFAELGLQKVISTNTPVFTTGISEPLFTIADGKRQSGAEYIRSLTDRPNFHLLKNTQVTKVLFDDNKNAIGVEAVTADGETVTYTARIEVVLAAGALHTPQLLMLSGVGPSDHLKSFNIPVVSDLPVGKNLHDHVSAILVHTLQEGETVTAPVNPHLFPVPLTTAYAALNNSQSYPDYQTINLIFSPDSTALVQFCSAVFSYKDEICQKFYDGGAGRATLFTINNLMMPYSRGEVLLSSSDPNDQPIIKHGTLSNDVDLDTMALSLQDFARILKTKPFQAAGSKFIDLDFPECRQYTKGSFNYWRCYALSMSATMWHYSSTASMGPVLDSRLRVKGVQKLRVVDASAMPNTISGNINAAVVVLAEKAADLIKKDTGAAPRMN